MIKSTPSYRCESMLNKPETTSKDDYRFGDIKSYPPTVYKPKEKCLRIRPPPLKNLHSLSDWTPAPVPFHIYHKKKSIVQTHPKKVQKTYVVPSDSGKDHAIKTRPRLVMTPAVSMDDIEDSKARDILIKDMYVSEMSRRLKEAIQPYKKVQAPMPSSPAVANPITLPKMRPPYVSPEWRMETVTWDQKQLRSHFDSTKEFWLSRPTFPCRACDESEKVAAHNKMMCELKPGRRLQRR